MSSPAKRRVAPPPSAVPRPVSLRVRGAAVPSAAKVASAPTRSIKPPTRPTAATATRPPVHRAKPQATAAHAHAAPVETVHEAPLDSATWLAQVRRAGDAVRQLPNKQTAHEEEEKHHDDYEDAYDEQENRAPSSRPAIRRAGSPHKGMRVSYSAEVSYEPEHHGYDEPEHPPAEAFRLPITAAMRRDADDGGAPTSRSAGKKPPLYKLRYGPTKAEQEAAEAEAVEAELQAREAELHSPEMSDEPTMVGKRRISSLPPPVSRSSRTGMPLSPITASPRIYSTDSTPRYPTSGRAAPHSAASSARSTPGSTPSSSFSIHGGTPAHSPAPFPTSSLQMSGSVDLSMTSEAPLPSDSVRVSASELIRRFREAPPRSREEREAEERRLAEPTPATPVAAPTRNIPWWMAEALASPFVSTASERSTSPRRSMSALSTIDASPPGSMHSTRDEHLQQSFYPRANSILRDSRDAAASFDPRTNSILADSADGRARMGVSFDPRANSILDQSSSSVNFADSFESVPSPRHGNKDMASTLNPRLSEEHMLATSDFSTYDSRKPGSSSGSKISLAEAARRSRDTGLYDSLDDAAPRSTSQSQSASALSDPFVDDDDDLRPLDDDDDDDMRASRPDFGATFLKPPSHTEDPFEELSAELEATHNSSSHGPPLLVSNDSSPKLGARSLGSGAESIEQRFFLPPDEHLTTSAKPKPRSSWEEAAADARDSFARIKSPDTQQIQDLSRFVRQSGNKSAMGFSSQNPDHEDDEDIRPGQEPSHQLGHDSRHDDSFDLALGLDDDSIEEDIHIGEEPALESSSLLVHPTQPVEAPTHSSSSFDFASPAPTSAPTVVPTPVSPPSEPSSPSSRSASSDDDFASAPPQSVLASMMMMAPVRARSGMGQGPSPTLTPAASSSAQWPPLPAFDGTLECDTCHEPSDDMVYCHDCKMKLCVASTSTASVTASRSFDFGMSQRIKSCHRSLHGAGKPFANHRVASIREQGAPVSADGAADELQRPSPVPSPLISARGEPAPPTTVAMTPSRTISAALAPRGGFDAVDANLKTLASVFAHGAPVPSPRLSINASVDEEERHPHGSPSHRESPTIVRRDRARLIGLTPSPPISPLAVDTPFGGHDADSNDSDHSHPKEPDAVKAAAALEAEIEEMQLASERRATAEAKEDEEASVEIIEAIATLSPKDELPPVQPSLILSPSQTSAPAPSALVRERSGTPSSSPTLFSHPSFRKLAGTPSQEVAPSAYLQMTPLDMHDLRARMMTPPASAVAVPTPSSATSSLPPIVTRAPTSVVQEKKDDDDIEVEDEADEEDEEDSTSGLNDSFIDRLLNKQKLAQAGAIEPTQVQRPGPPVSARDAAVASLSSAPLCSLCERATSVVHCSSCALDLCGQGGNQCDRDVHSVSDKMRKHVRETHAQRRLRKADERKERDAEAAKVQAAEKAEEEFQEWTKKRPHASSALPPLRTTSVSHHPVHHSFNYGPELSPATSTTPPRTGSAFQSFPLPADFGAPTPAATVAATPLLAQLATTVPVSVSTSAASTFSVPSSLSPVDAELNFGASSASLPSMEELEEALRTNAANLEAFGVTSGTPEECYEESEQSDSAVSSPEKPTNSLNERKEQPRSALFPAPSVLLSPIPTAVAAIAAVTTTPAVLDESSESWDTSVSSFVSEFESSPAVVAPLRKPSLRAAPSAQPQDHTSMRHAARDVQFSLDNAMHRFCAHVAPVESFPLAPARPSERDDTLRRVEQMLQRLVEQVPQAQAPQLLPAQAPKAASAPEPTPAHSSLAHLPLAAQQAVKAALRAAALSQHVSQPTSRPGVASKGQSLNLSRSRRASTVAPAVTTSVVPSIPVARPLIPPLPLPVPAESARSVAAAHLAPSARTGARVTLEDVSSTPPLDLSSRRSSVPDLSARAQVTSREHREVPAAANLTASVKRDELGRSQRPQRGADSQQLKKVTATSTNSNASAAPAAVAASAPGPSAEHQQMLAIIALQQSTIAEQAAILQDAERQRQVTRATEAASAQARQDDAVRFHQRAMQLAQTNHHRGLPPSGPSMTHHRAPSLTMASLQAPVHPVPASFVASDAHQALASSYPPRGASMFGAPMLSQSTRGAQVHPQLQSRPIQGMFASQRAPAPAHQQPRHYQSHPQPPPQLQQQPQPFSSYDQFAHARPAWLEQPSTAISAPFVAPAPIPASATSQSVGWTTDAHFVAPSVHASRPSVAAPAPVPSLPSYSLLSKTLDDSAKRRQQLQLLMQQ